MPPRRARSRAVRNGSIGCVGALSSSRQVSRDVSASSSGGAACASRRRRCSTKVHSAATNANSSASRPAHSAPAPDGRTAVRTASDGADSRPSGAVTTRAPDGGDSADSRTGASRPISSAATPLAVSHCPSGARSTRDATATEPLSVPCS